MVPYVLRRLLWMVPVLFMTTVVTFTIMHAAPGSPWNREGRDLDPRLMASLNERFGLNEPLPVQYVRWMGSVLRGDFGTRVEYVRPGVSPTPVLDVTVQAAGPTVQLGLMAFLLAIGVGIPLGIFAALRHNSAADYGATAAGVIGMGVPTFLLALILQLAFGSPVNPFSGEWSGLLPNAGWGAPAYWVLPTIALAALPLAYVTRFTRASVLEVLTQDYVRTAHSKGLDEPRIVTFHVIRNSLIPVVTVLGPILAVLLTGSLIVEPIFGIPGLGSLYLSAIAQRDFGTIMGLTTFFAAAAAFLNVAVDVLYAYIDPRIRYS